MKVILLCLFMHQLSFGHGGKDHSKEIAPKVDPTSSLVNAYKSIGQTYEKEIKNIFMGKCFDCHSGATTYPWYYKVPGFNILINSHIKEARSHLDMTRGFPFKSHVTPLEDLNELEKVVKKGSMPPWYYTPFHDGSKLTESDRSKVLKWINNSRQIIKDTK